MAMENGHGKDKAKNTRFDKNDKNNNRNAITTP